MEGSLLSPSLSPLRNEKHEAISRSERDGEMEGDQSSRQSAASVYELDFGFGYRLGLGEQESTTYISRGSKEEASPAVLVK